jgi:hypothetical protein
MAFPFLVDIYKLVESEDNAEPEDKPVLLHADVPFGWIRMSGNLRYLAAGIGTALARRGVSPFFADVNERCEIWNVRYKEGGPLPGEPQRFRIAYVEGKARNFHLEYDLEAWAP